MPNTKSKPFLLKEYEFYDTCEIIQESVNGEKNLYLQGIYQEAGTRNQNGRSYPENILFPEVERYANRYVNVNPSRAIGELDHPNTPSINLERVSHRIVELRIEGSKVLGKALIGGPKGDVVKKILDLGVQLGVSSRSLGTLDMNNRVNELQIITWDIVHEPSVSSALMENLVESVTYDWLPKEPDYFQQYTNLGEDFHKLKKDNSLSKKEKQIIFKVMFEQILSNLK